MIPVTNSAIELSVTCTSFSKLNSQDFSPEGGDVPYEPGCSLEIFTGWIMEHCEMSAQSCKVPPISPPIFLIS